MSGDGAGSFEILAPEETLAELGRRIRDMLPGSE